MHPHGGYLIKLDALNVGWLAEQALLALAQDAPGQASDLEVTVMGQGRLVRLSYTGRFAVGLAGAHWYGLHHALARQLSRHLPEVVHAYVFDPDASEKVLAFGNGQKVGGDELRYDEVDLDGDEGEGEFHRLQQSWPLGHLATVLGVPRESLLKVHQLPQARIDLSAPPACSLWELLPALLKGRDAPLAF